MGAYSRLGANSRLGAYSNKYGITAECTTLLYCSPGATKIFVPRASMVSSSSK